MPDPVTPPFVKTPAPLPCPVIERPAPLRVLCVIVTPPAAETLPVSVVAPDTVNAPRVVVPELTPEISRPPDPPGTVPAVYRDLPIDEAVVKSPAVVSCHTAVAIAAAVGGVPPPTLDTAASR